jgi:hypothetical protein
MSNISEFERTKPIVTMKNINAALNAVVDRMKNAESRSEQLFLNDLHGFLFDAKESLKKGE